MCGVVGKCGGLWGILVCGIVAVGRGVWGRETFPIVGWGQMWGCGLRDVQIFTNFDIFKKFLILTFFHHHHFVLRNINYLTKCHKIPSFSLHPANFPYVRQ